PVDEILQVQQGALALEPDLVPEPVEVAKVRGKDRVLAVLEPVRAGFTNPLPAGAVPGGAARQLAQPVEGLVPGRGDQAARVDGQQPGGVGDAEFGQVAGFPDQCQRVDDDVGTEVGARRVGGPRQGAGPELRVSVSAAVGQLDVVAGLAAAAIPDDEVGFQAPGQEIDG